MPPSIVKKYNMYIVLLIKLFILCQAKKVSPLSEFFLLANSYLKNTIHLYDYLKEKMIIYINIFPNKKYF